MNIKEPNIFIRPYMEDDWDEVCEVHDHSRPFELKGSCDLRAFKNFAKDEEEKTDLLGLNKLVAEREPNWTPTLVEPNWTPTLVICWSPCTSPS